MGGEGGLIRLSHACGQSAGCLIAAGGPSLQSAGHLFRQGPLPVLPAYICAFHCSPLFTHRRVFALRRAQGAFRLRHTLRSLSLLSSIRPQDEPVSPTLARPGPDEAPTQCRVRRLRARLAGQHEQCPLCSLRPFGCLPGASIVPYCFVNGPRLPVRAPNTPLVGTGSPQNPPAT